MKARPSISTADGVLVDEASPCAVSVKIRYPKEEQRLFDHYGFAYDARTYGNQPRIDTDFKVRSMERSDVAETAPSSTTRLRRYVVTETRH